MTDPSSERERLRSLSTQILERSTGVNELASQVMQLVSLIEHCTSADLNQGLNIGDNRSVLQSGIALSPSAAALCAREVFRSAAFIKGLGEAVSSVARGDRPVRVLYAGCGPYAFLALPLMALLPPTQVVFTLLDIHAASLVSARVLVEEFGLADHVAAYVEADATTYQVPATFIPDVIVSETMNVCLGKEPQVAITRHLRVQVPEAVMVPAAIRIEACMLDPVREQQNMFLGVGESLPKPEREYLGTVFELTGSSVSAWASMDGPSLPAARIVIPPGLARRFKFRLLTRIHVYGGFSLSDYDSSLNLPQKLAGDPELSGGEQLQFRYTLGEKPGLEYELSYPERHGAKEVSSG